MAKIGIIGLGEMGLASAARLCSLGHEVFGYDPSKQCQDRARDAGAVVVDSPATAASSADQAVLLLVGTAAQADSAVNGQRGCAPHLGGKTLVVMSSLDRATLTRLDDVARAAGGSVVDATMASGRDDARSGSMVLMVAGHEQALDAVQPVLDALAHSIVHFGDIAGNAQAAKQITQLMMCVNMMGMAEAMQMAEHYTLDQAAVLRALDLSPGASFVTANWTFLRSYMNAGHIENNHKDLRGLLAQAVHADIATPVASATLHALRGQWLRTLTKEAR